MNFNVIDNVRVVMPRMALDVIFDECDRFTQDETGGRVLGTFDDRGGKLTLHITGIIEPGPGAQRTPVSFFQNGEHQESVFRRIEADHPEIEHLGNWHTHHVNGLPTLSSGDIATYRRTVDHPKHNTTFFYALLVVSKCKTSESHQRYNVKHYLLRRGSERIHEIPAAMVEIVDSLLLWPSAVAGATKCGADSATATLGRRVERAYDRGVLSDCYPSFRPFASKRFGFHWRGSLELIDGSKVEVVVFEDPSSSVEPYSVALREPVEALKPVAAELADRTFRSALAAVIITERNCDRVLYEHRGSSQDQGRPRSEA